MRPPLEAWPQSGKGCAGWGVTLPCSLTTVPGVPSKGGGGRGCGRAPDSLP